MDSSKVEQIIDHFTSDTQLKSKILQTIAANKGGSRNLSSFLLAFNIDPGLRSRISDFIQKVKGGHDIDAVAGYYLSDRDKHENLRDAVAHHTASVKAIVSQ